MIEWSKAWSPSWRRGRRAAAWPGIDLGGGRVLGAEDVMESHYRRVRSRIYPVAVQVSDSLVAAIGVLAPGLAPLTEVAEQMATAVPAVTPEPEFRAHLHEALERTHRQHAAQRMLGTRRVAVRRRSPRGRWLVALVALTGLLLVWWGNRRPRPAVV